MVHTLAASSCLMVIKLEDTAAASPRALCQTHVLKQKKKAPRKMICGLRGVVLSPLCTACLPAAGKRLQKGGQVKGTLALASKAAS